MALVPLFVIFAPLVGALVVALFSKNPKRRNATVVIANLISFLLLIHMYRPVVAGISFGSHIYRGIEVSLPFVFGLGLNFRVDTVSLLIALVTSFVYSLSCIYATSYMAEEHAQTRYFSFVLLTLSANLGVLLAKDFFSLFIFFEAMAIFSYVLVIHEENKQAMEAGKLYIYMSIIGGLALLAGIILLYSFTGRLDIAPMASIIEKGMPSLKYPVAALMIAGFGTKAGIFFLHIWLPEAHPVAPTPASALLSGLMIKVGAYGIIRTVNTLFAPTHLTSTTLNNLGYVLIWTGVLTMFFGVVNALLSSNCKRMLAYHSVSQMGFIVMGIGCAAYLGRDGAMGLAGALYHIVNHALFKAGLFLSIGAVYLRTKELDMYKLGGLWRNMPFTCLACFIAVMGITGAPFFNGFASKTLLHHAINEAYEGSAQFSGTRLPILSLKLAEIIFMLTCFGTFCSNLKMWLFVFIWKRPEKYRDVKPEPASMKIALGALSVAILFIGLRPNWMIEKFIGPSLAYFGYEPASHPYHILFNLHAPAGILKSTIPILYDPRTLSAFGTTEALQNLVACGLVALGGGMVFVLGYRFGWFHVRPPEWVSVKYWYTKLAEAFVVAIPVPVRAFDAAWDGLVVAAMVSAWQPRIFPERNRSIAASMLDKASGYLQEIMLLARKFDGYLDQIITLSLVDIWVQRTGIGLSSAVSQHETSSGTILAGSNGQTFPAEEFEQIYISETFEKLTHALGATCSGLKSLDRRWDKIVTKVVLDSWLAEPLEAIFVGAERPPSKPGGGKIGEVSVEEFEQLDQLHQLYEELKNFKFNDFFKWIKTIDRRWDKMVTRVVLDAWLAGSPETILGLPSGEVPSSDKTKAGRGRAQEPDSLAELYAELKDLKFSDFFEWLKGLNERLDRMITKATVDTWLAGPSEDILGPTPDINLPEKKSGNGEKPDGEPDFQQLLNELFRELRSLKSSEFAIWLKEVNNRLDHFVTAASIEEPSAPEVDGKKDAAEANAKAKSPTSKLGRRLKRIFFD